MTVTSAPTGSAGPALVLSADQFKSQLFGDERWHVYAVLMGSRVPDLPARLAQALSGRQVQDFDCLRPGALPPAVRRDAPYLVSLRRDAAFTQWLVRTAAEDLGDWGVLLQAGASLLAMRSHLRSLLAAQLPGGQAIELDAMDPVILRALLPLFDAAGLSAFFGPVQSLWVPSASAWTLFTAPIGRLASHTHALTKAS